ncbi:uncharacterized protein LOC110985817 [Acanthaster planci]|uniref:Uncharacterized protein LOC110985817 n=1 Tax=Acanthaster planci TaxID=133434 RepID=A0A8B7ZD40_ACAPL|nr:uncharacterized protein LOC110985817 [Acanthaster planci]
MEMDTATAMSIATPVTVTTDGLTGASDGHVLVFPDDYTNSNIISTPNGITMTGPHDMLATIGLPALSQADVTQGTSMFSGTTEPSSDYGQKSTVSVGVQVNLCCCAHHGCNLVNRNSAPEVDETHALNSNGPFQVNPEQQSSKDREVDERKPVQEKDLLAASSPKSNIKHSYKDIKRKEKKHRKADKASACRKPKQQKVLTRRSTKSTLERRYLCEGCGIKFVHKATYDRHLQELRGKASENKCSHCKATFPFLCKLKQHIAAKHPDVTSSPARERPVICHICGIQLQTSISMNKHMRIHDGDKPFLCKYCPKAFRWHTGLEYHERIHTGERPFKCPNCPKAFTNPSDMARHQTVHTGKKPHLCHQCGKGFTQSGTLNAHIKSKHSQLTNSLNPSPATTLCAINTACADPISISTSLKQPDVHVHVCHLCGKHFPQDHMLDAHIRKSHQQPHPNMTLEGGLRCSTLEDMKLQLASCSALTQNQVFNMASCVPTEREIAEVVVNMLFVRISVVMPRFGKRGYKPVSARGYASAGVQHRIYIKKEDVPRWNAIRERSGYTKSPDFIHWLIEVAEQHLRIKPSEFPAEGNAGDDSHTSGESEEGDDDDDDDDDEDATEEEDNDRDSDPGQQSKETPKETKSSSSSYPDSHTKTVTIKEEELSLTEGGIVARGRSRRRGSPPVAIKDVAPIICVDIDAPRQLRPRLKLKLKPLKVEPVVEKPKRGRKKTQMRSLKKLTVKEKPASYSCKKCCRIFADRQALRSHQVIHAVDNLTCRDCQMTFSSKSAMWVHRKVQHGNKILACEHCDMTFPRKYQLKEHMRGHKGIKPFACPTCNKKFRTTAHLTSHMDLHSNFRRFLCDLCGLTFHRRDLLSRHIIKHSQPKTYSCEECGKVFAYKVTLQDHLIRHQNVKAGKTPYKCQTCFKEFFTPKSYQHHMGRHRGEKVFSCDQCDKKFKQKFYLDRHKIIHQEEKPYTCSNCGRGFTQHSNMTIHMRTHTGEKPYQCDLCEKAFAHNVSLKTHKKTAHGIDMWQSDKTKPIVALGRPKGEPKKKPPPKIRLKSRAAAAEVQIQSDLYQAAVEFARERLAPLAFPPMPQIPAIHGSPVEQIPPAQSPSESEDETPSPGSSPANTHTSPSIKTVLDHHPTHNHHEHQQVQDRHPSHDHQQIHDHHSSHDHPQSHDHRSTHNHHLSNEPHHQLPESHPTPEQKPLHSTPHPTCDRQPPCEMSASHDNHQDYGQPQANPEIPKQIPPLIQQYHERSQELNDHLTRGPQQFRKHDQPTREVCEQLTPIPQAYSDATHDVQEQMTPITQTYQEQSHEVREQLTPMSPPYPEHSTLEQHQATASRSQTPSSSATSSIEQPYAHILHNPGMHSASDHPLRLEKPGSPFGPLLHSPNAHSDYPTRHEKVEQWHQRNSEALSWMSRGVSHAQLMQGLRAVTPNMMHPVSQALGMLNPQAPEHVNLVGSYAHSAYIQRSNSTGSQPMQPPSWRS